MQLLPEFVDLPAGTYLEFSLAAKLQGSFTEQAAVLQSSVGAPYLTRNEARARLNLPPVSGGDELVTPLNVLIGGLASPQDTAPELADQLTQTLSSPMLESKSVAPDNAKALRRSRVLRARQQAASTFHTSLTDILNRQRRSIVSKLGAKSKSGVKATAQDVFDPERFNAELANDLKPAIRKLAGQMADTVAEWDPESAANYFDTVAENLSEEINTATFDRLDTILEEDGGVEEVDGLFDDIIDGTAFGYAVSLATSIGEFSRAEAASRADLPEKTWVVTSGNPRSTHSALDGETVPRNEDFSNGAPWPGHPSLEVEERANCACLVDWGV